MNFQPFVAEQVHSWTKKKLSSRMKQTGFLPSINVQADKGTNIRRTRQFTSVITIVPDSDTPICFIYLGQPVVKDHSGKGISQFPRHPLSNSKVWHTKSSIRRCQL